MPKTIDESAVYRAVIDGLIELGYAGLTTQVIAKTAGVNEVTLFRRYGTKAGLVEHAINAALSEAPLARVGYTGALQADLIGIVTAYLQTYSEYGNLVATMLVELPRHPELRAGMTTAQHNIEGVTGIMGRYVADKQLQPDDPLVHASRLLGPIMMLGLGARATALPVPAIEPRDHVRAFLSGARAPRRRARSS